MTTHVEPPPNWKLREVDVSQRYDVYYWGPRDRLVVYRNVLFKDYASLFRPEARVGIFVELEQANGQSVFLARNGLIRFCLHGTEVTAEEVSEHRGDER